MAERAIVLVMTAGYPPGYKQGGPIRSLENLVARIGDELAFKVITLDRYPGDASGYEGVTADRWVKRGNAEVLYLSPRRSGLNSIKEAMVQTPHDVLYLNSFFCPRFGLGPLWIHQRSLNSKVLLAPRGQFAPSALSIKWWKKRPCLILARGVGIARNVTWQATSEFEREDCIRVMGKDARVVVAPNLSMPPSAIKVSNRNKQKGELNVVFLSRISRMKNLTGAIRSIAMVRGRVRFSIYGVVDDVVYWSECKKLLSALPSHVEWTYHGEVPASSVPEVLAQQDVLLLPTMGENFGHVILEAMASGCPVLISDRTRWRNLEAAGVGWDLPVESETSFAEILGKMIEMDAAVHDAMRENARNYGMEVMKDSAALDANRRMFMGVVTD